MSPRPLRTFRSRAAVALPAFAAVLTLGLAACGSDNDTTTTVPDTAGIGDTTPAGAGVGTDPAPLDSTDTSTNGTDNVTGDGMQPDINGTEPAVAP